MSVVLGSHGIGLASISGIWGPGPGNLLAFGLTSMCRIQAGLLGLGGIGLNKCFEMIYLYEIRKDSYK